MSQSTSSSKENDVLAAFAGLVILMVILSILFLLTTPAVVGENTLAEATGGVEVVSTDEATEEPALVIEATAEVTEASVLEATEEAVAVAAEVTTEATDTLETVVEATVEVTQETAAVAAGDTASTAHDPELVARGAQLFITCSACHGPDGHGLPGLGKDLVAGEFATTATDEELFTLITTGRPIWDAANTTMVDMPPRGGNPAFTDEDIHAIIAYIRSLQNP